MANKSNYFPRRSSHFKNYKVILSRRGSHKEQANKTAIDPTNAYKNGTLEEITTSIIQAIYKQENYNQTRTAKRLGIGRTTLRRKLGLQ